MCELHILTVMWVNLKELITRNFVVQSELGNRYFKNNDDIDSDTLLKM